MIKALHHCPEGYRRLEVGEIIRDGDLENFCQNSQPFSSRFNGFIQVIGNNRGRVMPDYPNAYYRKLSFNLPSIVLHDLQRGDIIKPINGS